MLILGITGGIGSGKSYISSLLRARMNVPVYDCDTEAKSTYQIVGQYEANLEKGLISFISPLAKALIGKQLGDIVEVKTPKGDKAYEVLDVRYL